VDELPKYDDLPSLPHGGRSGWGVFGAEDNVGLLNLQTPERVRLAAKLIRHGRVFPLDAPVDAFKPPISSVRGLPRHHLLHERGTHFFDDVYDNFHPQGSSQWDSLAHVGYAPGVFYNGASEEDIWQGRRNTIDHWSRRGIVGRAVFLDLLRSRGRAGHPYDPGTDATFSIGDLEEARQMAGVEYEPGDVMILHTGFASWFVEQDGPTRSNFRKSPTTPGLAQDESLCRYLWDSRISAIGTDTYAVEALPGDPNLPMAFMHRLLIGQLGMALGELWWTHDLAADCDGDGVHEMFFCSAPLNAPGGVGSPANAIVIK
jgi:kynurenine formamidase